MVTDHCRTDYRREKGEEDMLGNSGGGSQVYQEVGLIQQARNLMEAT